MDSWEPNLYREKIELSSNWIESKWREERDGRRKMVENRKKSVGVYFEPLLNFTTFVGTVRNTKLHLVLNSLSAIYLSKSNVSYIIGIKFLR